MKLPSHYPSEVVAVGEVPTGWKRGNMTRIFKKGKKRKSWGNYRMVSLTSMPWKITE